MGPVSAGERGGGGRGAAAGRRRGAFVSRGVFATFDANHFGRVNADTESSERAFRVNSDGEKGILGATYAGFHG